jgi:hypothetical protein
VSGEETTDGTSLRSLARKISATNGGVNGYARSLSESDESLTEDGLLVYTQTGSGTAANTGTVYSPDGDPVSGAVVTLTPSSGGSPITATTDSDGAFAFVDVPVTGSSTSYDFKVVASGLGNYRVNNDPYAADETYVSSVEMTEDPQTFDESGTTALLGQEVLGTVGSNQYPSDQRVPPTIKVAMFRQTANCARDSANAYASRWYPWRFYVLHTAAGELYNTWGAKTWKATAAPIQGYAWAETRDGFEARGADESSFAHIENTTNDQCFKPQRKVPTAWGNRVGEVLEKRIVNNAGNIVHTTYRGGDSNDGCTPSEFPSNGNMLGQWSAKARAESDTSACGGDETWQNVTEYYYSYDVTGGSAPNAPNISSQRLNDGVRLNFDTPGAWKYEAQLYVNAGPDSGWYVIKKVGWGNKIRDIRTKVEYTTSACRSYRVRATNPVGNSSYSYYGEVCPS